jgi:3-oxoacyl-[acyl-carrier protein] reductase
MLTTESSGRRVLVTGSSGEIGSHLVAHFAAAGWTVFGVDVRPPQTTAQASVVSVTCDLADGAAATAALTKLAAQHGPPDVLVNCAGRIANSPLLKRGAEGWEVHDFALWRDVVESGLTSAFHATAICARLMLEARRKGVVVNISSVCANGNPGQVAYSSAKAGLNGMTLALAKELGPLGIRVVGLAPGYFETTSTTQNVSEARLAKVVGAVPLKRLGRVGEIAHALDFIIGNDYVNGTIIDLDGGLVV